MSWLHDQIKPVVDQVLDRVMPVAEKKLDELKADGLALIDRQINITREQVLALLPMLSATVAKTVMDQMVQKFAHVLDTDPDVPVLSSIVDISEMVRHGLNESTPPEIHIPVLSDVVGSIFKALPH